MLHRERELRARMRWVAIGFGLILVVGIVCTIGYVQKTRPGSSDAAKPLRSKTSAPR
jgi:hypothetical protein